LLVLSDFKRFCQDVHRATPYDQSGKEVKKIEEAKYLDLPNGVFWLGNRSAGSRLFVRKVYVKLTGLVEQQLHSKQSNKSKVIVYGNPGMGKSHWMGFYLWFLRTLDNPPEIVLECPSMEAAALFSGTKANPKFEFAADRAKWKSSALSKPDSYYLFDPAEDSSIQPIECTALTVIPSSPNPEHYKRLRKSNPSFFLMPIWSEDELLECRAMCYATTDEVPSAEPRRSVTIPEAKLRYQWWGGSVRGVLQESKDAGEPGLSSIRIMLEEKIKGTDLDAVKRSNGDCFLIPAASATALHFVVDENTLRKPAKLKPASQFVFNYLCRRSEKRTLQEVQDFLKMTAGSTWFAAARGQHLEAYLHRIREEGNLKLQARLLGR
jgi:hypothetical protein